MVGMVMGTEMNYFWQSFRGSMRPSEINYVTMHLCIEVQYMIKTLVKGFLFRFLHLRVFLSLCIFRIMYRNHSY